MDIILASQSPRRQELLKKIIPEFRVIPSRVDEELYREKDPLRFALAVAEAKAHEVGAAHPSSLVIAADTVVNFKDEVFGKPRDSAEAKSILKKLSGQRHRVITAIALFRQEDNRLLTGYEVSHVTFKNLSAAEIDGYLERSEFSDKAGSYAVQEVGDAFVARLEGDYENVVGFPVSRVKRLLEAFLLPAKVVSITDLALPHDWGVGILDCVVTFVPGSVPGDRARVTVAKIKKRHRFGRLVDLETPSPYRDEPECPHFGVCGGCSFQNLAYPKQLEVKDNYLLRTLQKIGRVELEAVEKAAIVPSPAVYYYRNKMEYAFAGEGKEIFLGLRERASPLEKYRKRTIPLRTCPIFTPAVERIFPAFVDWAKGVGLSAYHPLTRAGFLRNLVLREAKTTGEIMAVLVTKGGKTVELGELAPRLRENAPEVRSFWWAENERIPDLVDFQKKTLVAGDAAITERLGTLRFKIYPESFFQSNPQGAEILYGRVAEEVRFRAARKVLGLYCGAGSIEISISDAAAEVVGVDSEAMNIAAAEENCRLNEVQNCRFIQGRVENVLREHRFSDFDLLILDPPRPGISAKGMKHILGLNVPLIIYVSCNPASLARDVSLLAERGYRLEKLAAFDFFPHTPHLETLTVLAK
ncbi:MAG: 23S rRNA (uracil(1939)-C(5))-methyltransferase RlmD [Acidobacteriota bacterium]